MLDTFPRKDIKYRDFFTDKFNQKYKVTFTHSIDPAYSMGHYSICDLANNILCHISISLPRIVDTLLCPVSLGDEKAMVMNLMNRLITSEYHPVIRHAEDTPGEIARMLNKEWMMKYQEIFYQYIDREKWNNAT